jgi:molybdopterin converting factor small subunit
VRVEVRLFATLAQAAPTQRAGDPFTLELKDQATLADLVDALNVPPHTVHLTIVNGCIVQDRLTPLHEDDRVGLFPPVGGG